MKQLLFLILFLPLCAFQVSAQIVVNGPGTFVWTDSAPTHNPGSSGAKFAVNKNTFIWYEHISGTTWAASGDRIQTISGCSAPAYTPGNHQSRIVINGCTPIPELYAYTGSAWVKLNSGTTYTAGTGINITGTVIEADTSVLATQYDLSQVGISWPLLAPDGDANAPSYAFENSPGSGLYSDGVNIFFTSHSAGDVNILAKNTTDDEGGDININAANGSPGGSVIINAGNQNSGDGGTAGSFEARGGRNENIGGNGGQFFIAGGEAPSGEGGGFSMQAGNGAQGGGFTASAGSSTGDEISGGGFVLQAGNAGGVDATGGSLDILAGNSAQGGGGSLGIYGGSGPNGGGTVNISGGNAGLATAGNVNFNTQFLPVNMTIAQRNALLVLDVSATIYCTNCTANDGSTGVTQTYNGTTWKNHW